MSEFVMTIPQGEFISTPQRFRAYVAGYGAGKTVVGAVASLLKYASRETKRQLFAAPTYPHIRDIYFQTIDEVAYWLGFDVTIKEGNKEVDVYRSGQYYGTTICRSMDKPGSIIGFKVGHAHIDEIDVMPVAKSELAWRKIMARLRDTESRNTADVTTTPEGFLFTYRHFYKALLDEPQKSERYALIQTSTYSNRANLPADYIPSLLDAYPRELIDAYLHGQFVNLRSGTVYYAYNRKAHDTKESIVETGDVLYIGMDFNVGKMYASVAVKRDQVYHVIDELTDMFDTPSIIKLIKQRYIDEREHPCKIIIYPDSSGKNRKSVQASTSDIALLQAAGFTVRYLSQNPFVKDRVMSVNKAFQDGLVLVNAKKCKRLAGSLEQQVYDDNGEPEKKNDIDHPNDAFGYHISYEYPVTRGSTRPAAIMG